MQTGAYIMIIKKPHRGKLLLPHNAIYDEMASPVGLLTIIASPQGLHAILWESDRQNLKYESIINNLKKSDNDPIVLQTKWQLTEYFQGTRKIFDIPLIMNGTTFAIQVWHQLLTIPYASVSSYAELAAKIGNKNKARAVGMANSLNPISIIVPCHRVVGSNGHLVGFAGGIDKKSYLLNLENTNLL